MCIMVVLSVFMIAVVLFQPGGSDGLGAISGTSDTFFGKNKGKTTEGALKRLTIIAAVSLVVIAILFFVTMIIYNGVG
ncbi:MAG: preprotein translocase subunit SecG [Clostridiales bacterium]|nr:preprotein translocase subunit SecG [Clostridiales bacterium]